MQVALIALVVSATWAEEKAEEEAKPLIKAQVKRGLLGLGYGYEGGYDYAAPAAYPIAQAYEPAPFVHAAPITHHEKVVTVVKNVAVPYPVEKHIPYPVEKHVPYPVKVS